MSDEQKSRMERIRAEFDTRETFAEKTRCYITKELYDRTLFYRGKQFVFLFTPDYGDRKIFKSVHKALRAFVRVLKDSDIIHDESGLYAIRPDLPEGAPTEPPIYLININSMIGRHI